MNGQLQPAAHVHAPQAAAALEQVAASVAAARRAGRLPGEAADLVARICTDARGLLGRLAVLGANSPETHVVLSAVTSYLPTALGHYLRIPTDYATTAPVDAAGRTSAQVLTAQLAVLAGRIRDIADAASAADAAALLAHEEFLTDKFIHPPTPMAPAPPVVQPLTQLVAVSDPTITAPRRRPHPSAATVGPATATVLAFAAAVALVWLPSACSGPERPPTHVTTTIGDSR